MSPSIVYYTKQIGLLDCQRTALLASEFDSYATRGVYDPYSSCCVLTSGKDTVGQGRAGQGRARQGRARQTPARFVLNFFVFIFCGSAAAPLSLPSATPHYPVSLCLQCCYCCDHETQSFGRRSSKRHPKKKNVPPKTN